MNLDEFEVGYQTKLSFNKHITKCAQGCRFSMEASWVAGQRGRTYAASSEKSSDPSAAFLH